MQLPRFHATASALALLAFGAVGAGTALAASDGHGAAVRHDEHHSDTATPIKHLLPAPFCLPFGNPGFGRYLLRRNSAAITGSYGAAAVLSAARNPADLLATC